MTTRLIAVEALWTPADLAEFLQIAEKTLTDWRHRRIGPPYVRLGKHVRYAPATVRAWLAAQQTGTEVDDDDAA